MIVGIGTDCCDIERIAGAKLGLETIKFLQTLDAGDPIFKGVIDFSRVGLMGHSRGGDCVLAMVERINLPGAKIRAVISLAPVDSGAQSGHPKGIAFMTILPAGDGDVVDNDGAKFYDQADPAKSMFAARCAELGLPTVPVLAEFVSGNVSPERPNLPDVDLFSKPSDRWLGLGGTLWRRKSPGVYSHAASSETLSTTALCRRLCDDSQRVPEYGGSGSIVLQERVANHSSMLGALTKGGLATIRVVTCRTPTGSFDLLPPVIRMPVGDAIADNIAQGGLAAPIDVASGRISGPAIRKDKRIGASSHSTHPSTGTVLEGFLIPFWQDVIALTLRAHKAFPSVYSVGWDVAILPNGPILLEGNAWWDSDLTVLPHGITLSDTQFVKYSNRYFTELGLRGARSTGPN